MIATRRNLRPRKRELKKGEKEGENHKPVGYISSESAREEVVHEIIYIAALAIIKKENDSTNVVKTVGRFEEIPFKFKPVQKHTRSFLLSTKRRDKVTEHIRELTIFFFGALK